MLPDAKHSRFRAHMKLLKVPWPQSDPPLDRLIRKIGVDAPPIMFWGFGRFLILAAVIAPIAGAFWGFTMWVTVWQLKRPNVGFFFTSLLFGVFLGVVLAIVCSHGQAKLRKKYGLPSTWHEYQPPET